MKASAVILKGKGPTAAEYAHGGEKLVTTRSRFLKVPDVFRTDIERTSYGKSSPEGEMKAEDKSQKPVKPRG